VLKESTQNQPRDNQEKLQDKSEFLIKISINMRTQIGKLLSTLQERDTCLSLQLDKDVKS